MATGPLTKQRPSIKTAEGASHHAQWSTVVWDDPINTMAYVTQVFRRHFGYGLEKASALMLQVHNSGKAVVSTGPKERMEADVLAMHSYGLKATLESLTTA
ncbi:MAG: ATP-dependent Clp protease adapter ClpS [Actinomycetaceae bacterium]|nr:ATP-dependent Clp protease adapter ClpS [Actinomycetaceae bacterium]